MPRKNNKIAKTVEILRGLADALARDPSELDGILDAIAKRDRSARPETAPPDLDLFDSYSSEGEQGLRQKLEALDLSQLRALISANRLDSSGLARKWRTKDRLVAFLLTRVKARVAKGQAFEEEATTRELSVL
jgi:hypothetical protein